jgi:hypothetical protein
MAICAFCKAPKAQSYEYGVPICADCLGISNRNTDIYSALVQDLTEATFRFEAASTQFKFLIANLPSGGLRHLNGTLQIQNASQALTAARKEMGRAYDRLDDYLSSESCMRT